MTTQQSTPVRILVVEDDRRMADLYAEWLGGTYDVETAYDGTGALDQIDDTVDVVLLDRMMPGLSGGDVLEAVRDSGIDTRVVMVSAVTPDLDVIQMGFDAYLEKPVDASSLQETINRMLTRAEYDEKLQELFSLIERQDTLKAVKKPHELETSEEYRSLLERLESVQTDVESLLRGLPEEDFRVAVERLQRTAVERTSDRQYESLTGDVLDSSQEATVVVDADGSVVWANEAAERLLGFDRSTARGREYTTTAAEQFQDIEAEDESLASLIETGLTGRGKEIDATVHVPGDGERTERWLEYRSVPVETGLYAGGRIDHYHDITGRYRREQYLRALHRATRELMAAETVEAVVERALTTATTALEFPYTAIFTREDGTGDLVPAAQKTTDADVDPALPTLTGGSDPVWTVFANRTERLEAETHRDQGSAGEWLDDALDDWVLCPLGQQGVLLVGTTGGQSLSETELDLAETWAANTRQALEQLARTRELRHRDRELERQNERLLRLDRINRLIRSITPAVVSADTREEIESEVCRRLLRIDLVTGAWVADVDIPTDGTISRAAAGDLDSYLSDVPAVSLDSDHPRAVAETRPVPARRACDTKSSVSVTDLLSVEADVWWRDRGLTRGTNTIVAVPIVHGSVCFGALEVHIDRPQGASGEEIEAIEELGLTIGHAIGAIRQRDALLAGGTTGLTFRVEPDPTLSEFATVADVPLGTVDLSRRDDRTWAVFITLDITDEQDPDSLADRLEATTDASVIRSEAGEMTCVLALDDDSPIQGLIRHGVSLQEIAFRSDSEDLNATVQLPSGTSVREYVEDVTAALDSVELVAKRDESVDGDVRGMPATVLDGQLTDRQREVLTMAFHAGYFDWPRDNDAVTVATELDIAQSTFSQHLRTAERKLLEGLFA